MDKFLRAGKIRVERYKRAEARKTTAKGRWVWMCGAHNGARNWADSASCGARSRKPVATEALATAGFNRHEKSCKFRAFPAYRTIKNIGRKKWQK